MNIKKSKFEKIVMKQIRMKSDEFLSQIRDEHSKTENLQSYKFQTYLGSEKLTAEEKKLLFQLRTCSIQTKANYKNKYRFDLLVLYLKTRNLKRMMPTFFHIHSLMDFYLVFVFSFWFQSKPVSVP